MSTKSKREQQLPTSAFLANGLGQINMLLSKKGPRISQPGSLKPAPSETNVRKGDIYIN